MGKIVERERRVVVGLRRGDWGVIERSEVVEGVVEGIGRFDWEKASGVVFFDSKKESLGSTQRGGCGV